MASTSSNPSASSDELGDAVTLIDRSSQTTPAADGLSSGATVDHFRVIRRLGAGGMGEVYVARDTKLGRKVALKIVHRRLANSHEEKARLLEEARATATFNHPHIVTIHAVGEIEGRPYIAFEYLEGQDLRERLSDRPPTLPEALRAARAIGSALAEAHRRSLLHRDLKPENVVLTAEGQLRVVDFGLATRAASDEEASSLEAELGRLVGTPLYMAPEQWARLPLTGAADVWALGLILFELLAHRPPYERDRDLAAMMHDALSPDPMPRLDDVVDVPRPIADLVASCLAKDPSERPDAPSVVAALEAQLAGRSDVEPTEEGPFVGLSAFVERDAHRYYGRQEEIAAALERLRSQTTMIVVGPSGAGKSSFVRAGLVPRLRESGPLTLLTLRPGGDPFTALAARLSRRRESDSLRSGEYGKTDTRPVKELAAALHEEPHRLTLELQRRADETSTTVLLFVDQLEELFTQGADDDTQRRYLEALVTAADDVDDPVRVVVTVRDDFLVKMAMTPRARRALTQLTVLQTPGPDQLRAILARTVESVGYRFDDDALVDDMIAEVAGTAGALPMLQFAGRRLWEERDEESKTLTRSAYERMGGVGGALGTEGDALLDRLGSEALDTTRRLLLRLVTPDRTRRVVSRDEALDGLEDETATEVLDLLVEARLVTTGRRRGADGRVEATVELAHESLILNWTTLHRWVDDSHEDLTFLAEANQAATLWDKRGRGEAELWRDDALHDAWRAYERCREQAPERVRDFLETSAAAQRRRERRRRLLAAATFAALVIVALVLAWQKRSADQARNEAVAGRSEAERSRAQALREAARAAHQGDQPLRARALTRASLELEDHPDGRGLWWQLAADPLIWRRSPSDAVFYDVAFTADGTRLLAACQNRVIYLFDRITGESQALRGHTDQPVRVVALPDNQAVSTAWNGELVWWDLARRAPIRRLAGNGEPLWIVSLSPDGRRLITGGRELVVWDVGRQAEVSRLDADGLATSGGFLGDGDHFVVGSQKGDVTVLDTQTGEVRARWTATHHTMAVRPHRLEVALMAVNGVVEIRDPFTGDVLRRIDSMVPNALSVTFDPSGDVLIRTSEVEDVSLVDPDSGRAIGSLPNTSVARRAGFDAQGTAIAVSGFGTLSLWDFETARTRPALGGHGEGVVAVAASPDGTQVVSGDYSGALHVWDVESAETIALLKGHRQGIRALAFDPSGATIVSSGNDAVKVWDAETALARHSFETTRPRDVAVSADGGLAAATVEGNMIRVWDTSSGEEHRQIGPAPSGTFAVAFSPSDERIVVGAKSGHISVWDVDDETQLASAKPGDASIQAVTFVDEDTVLAGDAAGKVHRWPIEDEPAVFTTVGADGSTVRVYDIVRIFRDGTVLTADSAGGVERFDADGRHLGTVARFGDETNDIDLDRSQRLLVAGSDDSTIQVFDTTTWRPKWRGPALLRRPARAYTHGGWRSLSGDGFAPPRGPLASAIEEQADRVRESDDASTICILAPEQLSLWRHGAGAPVATAPISKPKEVIAVRDGCAVLTSEGARLLRADGSVMSLQAAAPPARAIGSDERDTIYLADDATVVVLDGAGRESRRFQTPPGATEVAPYGDHVAIGYRDGSVRVPADGKAEPPALEGTTASAVTRLGAGPSGNIVIGFANGGVGMWQVSGGRRLSFDRLHGAVRHLHVEQGHLHALTELGELRSWDLSPFYMERCELLREIWAAVPTALVGGRVTEASPPADHPCARQ